MPIFKHQERLHYFAHVPKCGGSSVENMLMERFGSLAFLDRAYLKSKPSSLRWSRSSPQHITWEEFERLVPEDWISSVFTVVRHPLARVVSAYHHASRMGRIPELQSIDSWFSRTTTLMKWRIGVFDRHLLPQVDFLPDCAEIFRLENGLDKVSDWLEATFGVSGHGNLPHELQSSRSPYVSRRTPTKISNSLRNRVADYYARDFAQLGYDPHDPATTDMVVYAPRRDAYRPRAHTRLAKAMMVSNASIYLMRMGIDIRKSSEISSG